MTIHHDEHKTGKIHHKLTGNVAEMNTLTSSNLLAVAENGIAGKKNLKLNNKCSKK